ncbi:hypothetical protein FACS1894120_3130 [Clostridia bacterium]|nr:hypothetical protein FACS1894120_3130 [Clostridia bacterium]
MQALQAISPLPIRFEQLQQGYDGYCRYDSHIAIREGMSEIQTILAAIHEISHAKIHNRHKENEQNNPEKKPKSKAFCEIEAEACAYATSNFMGVETSANSFGYIASYAAKVDVKELKQLLSGIQNATAEMISGIETAFKDIAKQRGVDISIRENAEITPTKTDELPKDIAVPQISTIAFINPKTATQSPFEGKQVGEIVLMPMLFNDNGNLERTAKRTRVRIENPIGKHQIFSRSVGTPPHETEEAYLLSQSGKLVHLGELEKVKAIPEIKIDEWIAGALQIFDRSLEVPTDWADYIGAALADKIDIAEAHNVPVKAAREAEIQAERSARIEQSNAEKQEREAVFTTQVDSIEQAIHKCEKCEVELEHYMDKNPLFAVFERHNLELPLATKGWVNRNLSAFHLDEKDVLIIWKPKKVSVSENFTTALRTLKERIDLSLGKENVQEQPTEIKSPKLTIAEKNYLKFEELFPTIVSEEFSYLHFESHGYEPLSVEYVDDNRISLMHTHEVNGDLCYDPNIVYEIDTQAKTLNAVSFEQSLPPMYQEVTENGNGLSVDGNGNQKEVQNLQGQINKFSEQWFENISQQGFVPTRGDAEIDDNDIRVNFDENGKLIMPERSAELEADNYRNFFDCFPQFGSDYAEEYTNLKFENSQGKTVEIDYTAQGADGEIVYKLSLNGKGNNQLAINHDTQIINCTANIDRAPEIVAAYENRMTVGLTNFLQHFQKSDYELKKYGVWDKEREEIVFSDVVVATHEQISEPTSDSVTLTTEQIAPLEKPSVIAEIKANQEIISTREHTIEKDYNVPDISLSKDNRDNYGYLNDEMLPLSKDKAFELFNSDMTIFRLHDDNSESMVFERDEIEQFDGMFGVEKSEWDKHIKAHNNAEKTAEHVPRNDREVI